ncbi:MAG: EAL domain-containing protein [Pseudomonadota bacterium]
MALRKKKMSAEAGTNRRLRQYELAERLGQFGHWYWPVDAEILIWSPELYRIHDVDPEQFETTVTNVFSTIVPVDRRNVRKSLVRAFRSKQDFGFEARIGLTNGGHRNVRTMGACEIDGSGKLRGIFGVTQDISNWRTAEDALAAARQRQIDFAEMSSDWLWEMGPDLCYTYISPQLEVVTGAPVNFYMGKTRREIIGEDLSLEMEMHLAWLDQHKPFRDFRFWSNTANGGRIYASISGKPVFDDAGTFMGYRGSGRDITKEEESHEALLKANRLMKAANKEKSDAMASLKEANAIMEEKAEELMRVQEKIRHTALHDPLTGIANRRFLDDRLDEWSARCKRSGGWLAALHIDLDRFKQINDTAGHAAGDALLVHVARTLEGTVRREDFVSRIGGDEFVVLCTGNEDQRVLSRIAERIIERTSEPFSFEGRECWYGASVGIAIAEGQDFDARELLVNADIALYRSKGNGRGRFEYFSESLQAEIVQAKRTADGIRAGLQRDEFVPFFQPQIDAATFEVIGFEALARWRHPTDGLLPPNDFLKIAEEMNTVAAIDRQILQKTVECYHKWTAKGLCIPRLSVNVSAKRLLEQDLIASLTDIDLPRDVLAFELLESIFLDNAEEQIAWNIDTLKEMGIDVELDDFGSGHASIISLVKLAPDAIKIDRELVATVLTDQARRNLVQSIVDIGKSLDVRVIAEGIECLDQAYVLREMGCDGLQGYFISMPLPAEDVPEFIRSWAVSAPKAVDNV